MSSDAPSRVPGAWMKLIVVGAGGATRDLLRGLGQAWDVTVIDPREDQLALAEEVRAIEPIRADGSEPETMARAGLGAETRAFVAASSSDAVNLAACRMARNAGVEAVAAVAADPERLGDYRELSVSAYSPDRLAARLVEVNLEPRRVSSAAFAEGQAVAIEFRIAHDSPVQGKRLAELASDAWLVVAILREGRLIVPHGGTVLRADDLVTVVGGEEDYSAMVKEFTSGEARFPLDHGPRIAVVVGSPADADGALAEARHLVRFSAATGMLVLHMDGRGADRVSGEDLEERLAAAADDVDIAVREASGGRWQVLAEVADEVGLFVVPAPRSGTIRGRRDIGRILGLAAATGRPVLVSRASHPYRRVVVSVADFAPERAAGAAAVDLVVLAKSSLVAVGVVPPAFMAGPEARDNVLRAVAKLREEAAAQGLGMERVVEQGNPVRVLMAAAGESSLLVLGAPLRRPLTLFPGTAGHLVARARSSVLLVPPREPS